MVITIASVTAGMVAFPEQMNMSTCAWISAVDLENVHFSIHADEDYDKPLPLVERPATHPCSYTSDINSLACVTI